MFNRKTKEEQKSLSLEDTKKNMSSSDNIFKELSGDLDFGKASQEEDSGNEKAKDTYYYMKISANILVSINIILFFLIGMGYAYVSVQNNPNLSMSYLDPFCTLLLGSEIAQSESPCSSVTTKKNNVVEIQNKLKADITEKVKSIAGSLYAVDNFVNSPEVIFLQNKKTNKLRIIDMMNDFDNLKNDFASGDKKMIQCAGVNITSDNVLEVNCEIFTSNWETPNDKERTGIIASNGDVNTDRIQGTSISSAASFLNFIEKNPQYKFQLLEKQKVFTSDFIVGEGNYVKKTSVKLKLKYNNFVNSLSL